MAMAGPASLGGHWAMRDLELGMETEKLRALGALWTAREIAQQPAMLRQTRLLLETARPDIDRYLGPLLKQPDLRVILTGAGSSAFIGACLAPYLASVLPCHVEAIASTDIVSAPQLYLPRQEPVLLVSFARSGNSRSPDS